ncbi:MAG: ribonuclease III [Ruminococcaceae bacterium]|nr:ribonuclease III [Oscillospiraceae bacterium]
MLEALQARLGYNFRDPELLKSALMHSSYANENRTKGYESNERLEFLGDSILGFVVADYLYRTYPDRPEGEMTRTRAGMVCEEALHQVALALKLNEHLLLGVGEEKNGGRDRASINADAVECVIAATYLDGGITAARSLIERLILPLDQSVKPKTADAKTALQELIQQKKGQVLTYRQLASEGPDHDKRFVCAVFLNGEQLASGAGRSKKAAEQAAAAIALQLLEQE